MTLALLIFVSLSFLWLAMMMVRLDIKMGRALDSLTSFADDFHTFMDESAQFHKELLASLSNEGCDEGK